MSFADSQAIASGEAMVSVVIPTRNRRALLGRAIGSVLAQSHRHLELLVVDGGSTDGTQAAVRALSDPRVRLIALEDSRGGAHNRQAGALASRGDFIAFLDSDDFWLPDKLAEQLRAMSQGAPPPDVVVSQPICFDGVRYFPPQATTHDASQPLVELILVRPRLNLVSGGIMVRGALGRQLTFDAALSVHQDTDYLLRLEAFGARTLCMSQALWVLDIQPRRDRISYDARNLDRSLAWFAAVSGHWPRAAQRGFLYCDTVIRHARAGRRARAIWLWMGTCRAASSPVEALRQLLRVLGGGEVSRSIHRLLQGLGLGRRPAADSVIRVPPSVF